LTCGRLQRSRIGRSVKLHRNRITSNSDEIGKNKKLCAVIALGYGATQGTLHKSKDRCNVMKVSGEVPDWFQNGITTALLAPTAVNQQKFRSELEGNTVKAEAGRGFYTKLDLGIVKYHFEVGAGKENFTWANG
jgi:hypothetical protein